jgi:hypothetical protein
MYSNGLPANLMVLPLSVGFPLDIDQPYSILNSLSRGTVNTLGEPCRRRARARQDPDKSAWAYCPKCREKVKADFPDHSARIKALQLALEHGYGKPGQSKTEERLDLDIDVQSLTPEARATLRQKLLALNPDLPQTWIG